MGKNEQSDFEIDANQYKRLFDAVEGVVYTVTPSGTITSLNPHFEKLTGWPSEEWIGRSFAGLFHPVDLLHISKLFPKILAGQEIPSIEARIFTKSGQYITTDLKAMPVRENGKVSGIIGIGLKVKDMSESERELRESEAKYLQLTSTIPGLVYQCNLSEDGKSSFVYVNEKVRDIWGDEPEKWISDSTAYFKKIHPEDKERLLAESGKALRTGMDFDMQFRVIKEEGDIRWVHNKSAMLRLPGGQSLWNGVTFDITEIKRKEEELLTALADSEERFRSLFYTNQLVKLVIDPEIGRIMDANDAACVFYGYEKEDLLSQNIMDINTLTHEEVKEEMRMAKEEKRNHFYFKHRLANGDIRDVEVYSAPYHAGGKSELFSIIYDVTERKQAEKAIQTSHNRLLAVLDSLEAIVYVSDMDTYEVLFVNKYVKDLFGDVTGDVCWKTIQTGQTGPCEFCSNKHLLTPGGEPAGVYRWELQNTGNGRWYDLHDRAIKWVDGRTVRLEIATDITDRKKAEDELVKAKEKAESATKLKNKFVSLVAHDLRSPFTSLVGMLKFIESDSVGCLGPKQKEMLSAAIGSGERMIDLIEDLLNLSRLKSGDIKPRQFFFDCNIAAEEAIEMSRQLAISKNVELVNNIPKGTRLYADRDLIREVLINLISNAIKFSGAGDEIILFVPENKMSVIAVRDSGVGIPEDMVKGLFKEEVKTSTEGTAGERGTGLGLPLSYNIMKAHGGALSVETEDGVGSVFYLSVPPKRPKILIADDDKAVRQFVRIYLEREDVMILEAGDGNEALELIKEDKPDLVISDIYMPVMDGFDLIKKLRSRTETLNMPIIVVTTDSEISTRERALRLGADDFTTKPFSMSDLIPRVRRFIS